MRNADVWGPAFDRGVLGTCRAHARRTGGDESACGGPPPERDPSIVVLTMTPHETDPWSWWAVVDPLVSDLTLVWNPLVEQQVPILNSDPTLVPFLPAEGANSYWVDLLDDLGSWDDGTKIVQSVRVHVPNDEPPVNP